METHHCLNCYNILFMSKLNAYPIDIDTIAIAKIYTLNIIEVTNGFIACERCNFTVGEIFDNENYNIFLEKVKIFNTEQNRFNG